MARWKLMTPHYINLVEPTEWEYIAVEMGKQRRKRFIVPRLLDPNDPGDWTIRWGQPDTDNVVGNSGGAVVVCLSGKGGPGDLAFVGDPTPDMMPIDDEAREISASFGDRWRYKPDNTEISFSQSLVDAADAIRDATASAPSVVKIEGFDELMASMVETQKLIATALTTNARRI